MVVVKICNKLMLQQNWQKSPEPHQMSVASAANDTVLRLS